MPKVKAVIIEDVCPHAESVIRATVFVDSGDLISELSLTASPGEVPIRHVEAWAQASVDQRMKATTT